MSVMTPAPRYVDVVDEAEFPLLGGDVSDGLVRRGSTVRRPRGAHSPAVEAYLLHLERVGFPRAPRFLGVDGAGREVVSFVEGEWGGRPPSPWALGEDVLVQLGEWQRALHDASATVALPDGVAWPERVQFPGVRDVFEEPDVVGHNDVTVENSVFSRAADGRRELAAVIDFDLAGPTTRLLDVATTALHWAPIGPPGARDAGMSSLGAPRRTRVLTEAYGFDRAERLALLDTLTARFARSWHAMRHNAATRGGGWQRMWDGGVGDRIRANEAWFAAERGAFARELG